MYNKHFEQTQRIHQQNSQWRRWAERIKSKHTNVIKQSKTHYERVKKVAFQNDCKKDSITDAHMTFFILCHSNAFITLCWMHIWLDSWWRLSSKGNERCARDMLTHYVVSAWHIFQSNTLSCIHNLVFC